MLSQAYGELGRGNKPFRLYCKKIFGGKYVFEEFSLGLVGEALFFSRLCRFTLL